MKKFAYVDSFVLAVPKNKMNEYKKIANAFGSLVMKLGALEYIECVADDVESGEVTSFPQAVKAKKGEVVVVSYVKYKSRAQRNSVRKKVMNHPAMEEMRNLDMPFDGMRMFWGGFKPIVKL